MEDEKIINQMEQQETVAEKDEFPDLIKEVKRISGTKSDKMARVLFKLAAKIYKLEQRIRDLENR